MTADEWFDEMMRRAYVRDNERFNTDWTRYSVENDEIKVEYIDPRTAYFEEYANISWNSSLRFLDSPPPYVRYHDPQTRLTHVAVAVKIALDGSVN